MLVFLVEEPSTGDLTAYLSATLRVLALHLADARPATRRTCPPAAADGARSSSRLGAVSTLGTVNMRQRKKLTKRLMSAVLSEDAAAVSVLLRAGADPNVADRDRTTPLYLASVQGTADLVRLLLAAGAVPDTESGRGQEGTPLCAAAAWGHNTVVHLLLAHNADPNLREDRGTGLSPLDWALRGDHSQAVDLLMAAGAKRTAVSDAGI